MFNVPRHEQPVEHPKRTAHQQPDHNRDGRWYAGIDCQRGHHNGAEGHHRAIRQVNPGGEDDQRLTDAQGADDHHLLHDQGQVGASQKSI
jgi:hypothetical protein